MSFDVTIDCLVWNDLWPIPLLSLLLLQFLSLLFAIWCWLHGLLLVVSSWLFRWTFAFLFLTSFWCHIDGSRICVCCFYSNWGFWEELISAGIPLYWPLSFLKILKDWSINIESSFSSINSSSHEFSSSFRSSGMIVLISSTNCLISYAAASRHLAVHRAFASRRSFSAPARARPLSFANDTCCLNSVLASLLFCPFLQSSHSRGIVREERSNVSTITLQ